MKRVYMMLTAALLLSACGASAKNDSAFPPLGKDADYALSQNIIPDLENKALKGDGDAALDLCLHYEYAARKHVEAMYWLKTAAENGNKLAAKHLGELMLADSNDTRHYLRAPFWLKKAQQ